VARAQRRDRRASSADSGGGGDGCGCTHFALSRVGRGEPLHAQLLNAWLV